MTAGRNGSGAPSDDEDPFGYLYRSDGDSSAQASPQADGTGGAAGHPAPPQRPGVPRTSYTQVRPVGERSYGGAAQQPSPHYAAPETLPGGRAAARQRAAGAGHGRARRGGTGLLVGALAVVAAVVLGVGAAVYFSDGSSHTTQGPGPGASPTVDDRDGEDEDRSPTPTRAELPEGDAATFTLGGDAAVRSDIPGAKAQGGRYVVMDKPGSSATWTAEIPQAGRYRLYVGYGVPGRKMDLTLWVNGERQERPLNMDNFAKAPEGDWTKGWTYTYADVNLTEGKNAIMFSCEEGNACQVALDRTWLKELPAD